MDNNVDLSTKPKPEHKKFELPSFDDAKVDPSIKNAEVIGIAAEVDSELKVIENMLSELNSLPHEIAQRRVLMYLTSRLELDVIVQ